MKPSISRRRFLAGAFAAAAAAARPLPRARAARVAPGERIQVGIIGMGVQGRALLEDLLARPDVAVLAVCDVDATRRRHARRMVEAFYADTAGMSGPGSCQEYLDFRDVLGRRDIDAVVIAAPDHWHALIGILAARARKDLYCETPMSYSIREARELARVVRRNRCIFQTGSTLRSEPEFRRACQIIRNGAIGVIQEIHVAVGGPPRWCDLPPEPTEQGLDWNLWLGPAPWREYNSVLSPRGVHKHEPRWREYREYSGGGVTQMGSQLFDIAQWALGMDESGPIEVLPPESPDAGYGVRIIYPGGTVMRHVEGRGITFIGTSGRIRVDHGVFEAHPEYLAGIPLEAYKLQLPRSDDHVGDWLESIRSRRRPIADAEVGARTATVCHLVNIAYLTGRHLKWDPEKEVFLPRFGDNAWKDRLYRDPWGLDQILAG